MKERLVSTWNQSREHWGKLPVAARVGVAALAVGLVAVSLWLVLKSSDDQFEPLYDQPVELARAAEIRDHLEARSVPYRIASDGSILVTWQ